MTAKNLNNKLIECFPEIEKEFRECVAWQDGEETSAHIVFACVFVPYIINSANLCDLKALEKCASFMEDIISYADLYSEEVIAFSVLENLMFSSDLKNDIYKFLGERTKKLYKEVFDWWKRMDNSQWMNNRKGG